MLNISHKFQNRLPVIHKHSGADTGRKLILIKTLHTFIWLFYNVIVFYMLYAVSTGRFYIWLWIGFALVIAEGIVLALFGLVCPLTILARKFSDSTLDNFDIYLPNWLARYTKVIYSSLFVTLP